jgi:hypothetical protein
MSSIRPYAQATRFAPTVPSVMNEIEPISGCRQRARRTARWRARIALETAHRRAAGEHRGEHEPR